MIKKKIKPGVFWITGLSASGKTSIAKLFYYYLKKKYSKVIWLDGDKLRKKLKLFHKASTFSFNNRVKIGKRYTKIASYYERKGYLVIISVMALSKKVFKFNRLQIKTYHEIFLNVPLTELKRRDPKKIYEKFRLGKIRNVAGLDLKIDRPKNPGLLINWKKGMSKSFISNKLKKYFYKFH